MPQVFPEITNLLVRASIAGLVRIPIVAAEGTLR